MTAVEKIDYSLIPVIDVAHELLGQESRETQDRQRKALSRSWRPVRQSQEKQVVLPRRKHGRRCYRPHPLCQRLRL